MALTIQPLSEADLTTAHAILTLCGEHMHRVQGLSHWYPYRNIERYRQETQAATVYGVYDDSWLVGTFYLTPVMRTWYSTVAWEDPNHRALYLGSLGILPSVQGRGIGKAVMGHILQMAQQGGYAALRFDGVANNAPLLHFYDQLGFTQRGLLVTPSQVSVMVFEKILPAAL
ncbi:MAG: GNAT family N-acetyltransferase [Phototrophicaceae bacterium]